jgi:hypothetical protein
LYDKANAGYNNQNKKAALWNEIAEGAGFVGNF